MQRIIVGEMVVRNFHNLKIFTCYCLDLPARRTDLQQKWSAEDRASCDIEEPLGEGRRCYISEAGHEGAKALTTQPRWEHTAERTCCLPSSSQYLAAFFNPWCICSIYIMRLYHLQKNHARSFLQSGCLCTAITIFGANERKKGPQWVQRVWLACKHTSECTVQSQLAQRCFRITF